jgi:hypothetical protein
MGILLTVFVISSLVMARKWMPRGAKLAPVHVKKPKKF